MTTHADLSARLAAMISEACDGEISAAEISAADCSLAALGVTSLAQLRLLDAIEDEFGLEVDLNGYVDNLGSLADLARYVSERAA
ncbi:acyl carrier protein [Microbispora sp. NPDC049125]|uniref:acyl carrier protein n=1 Tax=Microbispora sp. NPDC049125 TaxID=3154929 RepID=UPI0034660DEE